MRLNKYQRRRSVRAHEHHLAAAIAETLESRRLLAHYLVTTTGDGAFLFPSGGDGSAGDPFQIASLRSALQQSIANAGADTITFGVTGTINLTSELPELLTDIDIHGSGVDNLTVRRDTGGDYRIFTVGVGATVSISKMTIANGFVTGAAPFGGGILNSGELHLTETRVTGNHARGEDSTVAVGLPAGGGGIYNAAGQLYLFRTNVNLNTARGGDGVGATGFRQGGVAQGGAIFTNGGSVHINLSLINDNQVIGGTAGAGSGPGDGGTVEGGAIFSAGNATIDIIDSNILSNHAIGGRAERVDGNNRGGGARGGAVRHLSGTLTVERTLFAGNVSRGGQGSALAGAGLGGALDINGSATIVNSTISSNMAVGGIAPGAGGNSIAGAVRNDGSVTLRNVTITANDSIRGSSPGATATAGAVSTSVATFFIANTIIAHNDASDGNPDVEGNFTSLGHNRVGISTDGSLNGFTGSGDLVGSSASPLTLHLGPLANNGGDSFTHALLSGSPAIDGGDNDLALNVDGIPLTVDQRGATRIVGGKVDVGAVESPDSAPVADAGGPYNVDEGGSITLAGSGFDGEDPAASLVYEWDFDNDDQFDDATGATPTFSATSLDGPTVVPVSLRVTDTGGLSSISSTNVIVNNVAPIGSFSAPPTNVKLNTTLNFAGDATDVPADAIVQWNWTVLKDGAFYTTSSLRHFAFKPTEVGVYTISLVATDDDGSSSAAVDATFTVFGAHLIADPHFIGEKTLLVGGTTGNDEINFAWVSHSVAVTINGISWGSWKPTAVITALGREGNDSITANENVPLPRILYGQGGNDTLTTGSYGDILLGGDGDDVISSGNDRDIAIGGLGRDNINTGESSDILIGGATVYDSPTTANYLSLCRMMDEWYDLSETYGQRVAHLTGTPGGFNGGNYFNAFTITDDNAADTLTGGASRDLYLGRKPSDITTDKASDETFITI